MGYKRIFEISMSRRNLIARLASIQWEVVRHLFKLKMQGSAEANNHWKQEIFAMLLGCHVKLKQDNKYPTLEFYFENLWGNLDSEERKSWITGAIDSVFDHAPDYDYEKVEFRIIKVFHEISNLLSSSNFNRENLYIILDKWRYENGI